VEKGGAKVRFGYSIEIIFVNEFSRTEVVSPSVLKLNVENETVERKLVIFGFTNSEEHVFRGHEMDSVLPRFNFNIFRLKSCVSKSI